MSSVVKAIRAKIKSDSALMNVVKAVEVNVIPDSSQYPAVYIAQSDMAKVHCYGGWVMKGSVEVGVYADTYQTAESVIDRLRTLFDMQKQAFEGISITYSSGEEEPDTYDEIVKKNVKAITFPVVATK